jgi:hypothetical protein
LQDFRNIPNPTDHKGISGIELIPEQIFGGRLTGRCRNLPGWNSDMPNKNRRSNSS